MGMVAGCSVSRGTASGSMHSRGPVASTRAHTHTAVLCCKIDGLQCSFRTKCSCRLFLFHGLWLVRKKSTFLPSKPFFVKPQSAILKCINTRVYFMFNLELCSSIRGSTSKSTSSIITAYFSHRLICLVFRVYFKGPSFSHTHASTHCPIAHFIVVKKHKKHGRATAPRFTSRTA